MKIQITLDKFRTLHVIPYINNTLVFDYNKGYLKLKSATLVNTFLWSLPENISAQLTKLLEGKSLVFYYHSPVQDFNVFPHHSFRKYLRKVRYDIETAKITSVIYSRLDDAARTLYIDNCNYKKLPLYVNSTTDFDIFEIKSNCMDDLALRLYYGWIIQKRAVLVKSYTLDDGGITAILEFPDTYVVNSINHTNKDIHSLKQKCDQCGWRLYYDSTAIPNVMILSIYRESFDAPDAMRYGWNRDTLKTICYQSYKQVH